MVGKLIVFEGLDGSGGETQTNNLISYLRSKGKEVMWITYPDYGPDKKNPSKAIGKLIYDWLHKRTEDFDEKVQFLLYTTDMVKDIKRIQEALNSGKFVVADRYVTSTMAFQGLKGFPLDKALKYADLFGLIKPDVVIYLDISVDTSLQRKMKEKDGNLDRHEEDREFLDRLTRFYKNLIKDNVFGKWISVDAEKPKEEIFNEIKDIVEKHL